MNDVLKHEEIYRGSAALQRVSSCVILVVGCGALGSNLLETLARQGFKTLHSLDFDRVEEHNLGTQAFRVSDIGSLKVMAMATHLYAINKVQLRTTHKKLTESNAKALLRGYNLIVDCLDNSEARQILWQFAKEHNVPMVHAGLFENYGEVIWQEDYKVPKNVAGDVCEYPLARNIIMLTVSVLAEVIVDYIAFGRKRNFAITLRDLKVSEIPHKTGV